MRKNLKRKISILLASCALFVMGLGFSLLQKQPTTVEARAEVLNGFVVDETAAIRSQNPVGIRFTVNLGETAQQAYNDLENVSCGSILLPEDMLDGELTLETSNVLNVPTEIWRQEGVTYQSVLGGSVDDGGNIMDIPESFYNRPIVARGYITGKKNEISYTYYTENTSVRSIGYVAAMATDAGETSDLLTTIVGKVEYGVVANDYTMSTSVGDGAILRNQYVAQADVLNAAYFTIGGIKYDLGNITYSIDNTGVAAIEDGKIVAKATGNATLTASYTYNGNVYSNTSSITVTDEFVGTSNYSILLPASATANETAAANTLKKVFAKAGASLPIVNETGNETTADKYISIGETALAKANVALSVTKNTASQVATVDNMMFIRGLTDVGTLNGVQQWLGDVLDYDYFLKDTYSVEAQSVGLPTAMSYVPEIEYNMIDRNADLMQEYGLQKYSDGVIQVGGNIHNSTIILDPDTYYNTYSDWYATKTTKILWWENVELIKDASGKAAELCYTAHGNATAYNAMVEAAANAIVNAFKENPTQNRASFSVRDGYYYCNCTACEAKGNTSDTLVIFLNDVCTKVAEGLAGDARQSTFKIVTLAYHQTNAAPKNISSLTNYSSFKNHIELWFGDSYGDYTDGLKDSSSAKNQEIYANFQAWTNLVGDADVLLWVYYTNTKNGFVPYNTFTAIRENYAMAYDAGVDYLFNQTIQGRTGWTMLKHYLISQLAWNAKPTDAEWNGWLDTYFANAYGNGATAMRNWFNDWLNDSLGAYATEDSDPALHRDMLTTANFPKATLEQWIAYADAALLNLDKNDPNYTQYYNNIILEKLSPEYLLIELYGMTADYAEEFVWGVGAWGITHLGESVTIDATLEEVSASIESATISDKFYAELQADGTYLVTLENGNIKAGTTYTLTGGTTVSSITAATDGELSVYLNTSATVGVANTVTVTSSDYAVTFNNVIAVTKILKTAADINVLNGAAVGAGNYVTGYYLLGNDIDCADALYEANSYSTGFFRGVFDGNNYTISNIKVGSCGIFGALYAATIKDVNFTNVSIVATANNFNGLLAGSVTNNSTIENVNVSFKAIEWPYANSYADNKMTGLLAVRWSNTVHTVRNVTLDAGALTITNALGFEISNVTFENVNVLANDVTLIACTTAYDNTSKLSAWPTGVTYTDTYEESTISEQFFAEAGVISLESDKFVVGEIYTVTVNGATVQTVVAEAGKLTATVGGMATGIVSVVCETDGKLITFTNVLSVTKILRTAEDLRVLNAYTASGNITGYYILGGDVDCGGATYSATGRDGTKAFAGTFDGRGYTIRNLKAGANGIFNLIVGGTVRNVNFEGVSIIKDNYHFTGLLAGQSWGNTTIENISVKFDAIEWPINNVLTDWAATGLLIARLSSASGTIFRNVTIDATGLAITNALGTEITGVQYQNVTIKGDSVALIGCTSANSSTGVAEWPTGVTYIKTQAMNITAPAASDYYTFTGAASVAQGGNYTFTVTEKVSGLNDFIVLVNGEEVTGNNGTYTVANVTEDLTIQVLHGYIEHGEKVTVTYNADGSIKVENAVFANGNAANAPWLAYISVEYIEYMIGKGYKNVGFTIQADGAIMAQAVASYNGTIFVYHIDGTAKYFEKALGTTVSNDLQFWGQSSGGSGNAIKDQGGYITITNLVFFKEAFAVTAPADNAYYTFTGNAVAPEGSNYTFKVTEKVSGLNDFVVLVNGEEVTGNNGTYTVANVSEALTIEVLHGYVQTGNVSSAKYVGDKLIITNSTSTNVADYMAYISADYVNYMLAQGYTNVYIYMQPDGTVSGQAIVACGNTIVRTPSNYTSVANVTLQADTMIKFWSQNANGSGSAIQGQGGYMTITGISYISTAGTQSGMPTTVAVTAPAENNYYTFAGENAVIVGTDYTFTVTATKEHCTDFVVFVNGVETTGNNGAYTIENVTEALEIKVIHGYIEYGSTSSVTYSANNVATVTNSTSTNSSAFMAYISADYVNYLISKGYNYWDFYIVPDGTTADMALVMCGNSIGRTIDNGSTAIARVQLKADTALVFWCQKGGSGSAIQGAGGYMTVTYGEFRENA